MTKCTESGCRNLEQRCLDCGRLVCDYKISNHAPEGLKSISINEYYSGLSWIDVKDSLPEVGKVCLLYQTYPEGTMFNCRANPIERNFYFLGGLNYRKEFISNENQYGNPVEYISHWMPLPNPPKQ